jgi:penicillin-binding protein 1A
MAEAVKKYGGTSSNCRRAAISEDRPLYRRKLGPDATGDNVISEYFREGEELLFGLDALVDGFAMRSSLPLCYRETIVARNRWTL